MAMTLQEGTFLRLSGMLSSVQEAINKNDLASANSRLEKYKKESQELLENSEKTSLADRARGIEAYLEQQKAVLNTVRANNPSLATRAFCLIKASAKAAIDAVGKINLIALGIIALTWFYSVNLSFACMCLYLGYKVASSLLCSGAKTPTMALQPTAQAATSASSTSLSSSSSSSSSSSAVSASAVETAKESEEEIPNLTKIKLENARQNEAARINSNAAPPACTVHAFQALIYNFTHFEWLNTCLENKSARFLSQSQNNIIDFGIAQYGPLLKQIQEARRPEERAQPNIGLSEYVKFALPRGWQASEVKNIASVNAGSIEPLADFLFSNDREISQYRGLALTNANNESFSISSNGRMAIIFDSHLNLMVFAKTKEAAKQYLIKKLGQNVDPAYPTSIDYIEIQKRA